MNRPRRSPRGPEPIDIDGLLPPFAPHDGAERWLFRLQRLGIRPGLDAMRELLDHLGHPERRMRCLVVAGTNGKGSASIILSELLRSAGLRTGLYTSPHLLGVRERIRVDGEAIDPTELFALVSAHRRSIETTRATFFEALTGIALQHFARRGVEVAVLEAGLGGRLDATNAVDKIGVLLTNVALDHQELLGDTVQAIALEKLGLASAGVPFYLDVLDPGLMGLARDFLAGAGAERVEVDDLLRARVAGPGPRTPAVEGVTQRAQCERLCPVAEDLARRNGWSRPDPERAFADVRLSGRYELRGTRPRLILDTAHNANALGRVLAQFRGETTEAGRILVFAAMRDKALDEVAPEIVTSAGTVFVTAPRWYRARDPEELAGVLRRADPRRKVLVRGGVRETLEAARTLALERQAEGVQPSILVCGSNFLVAEALDRLGFDELESAGPSAAWDEGRPLRRRQLERLGVQVL